MKRKDCDNPNPTSPFTGRLRRAQAPLLLLSIGLFAGPLTSQALGGAIRVWPTTVVVNDTVHLSDVGELKGFDHEVELRLLELVVSPAPAPGGSRVIHRDMIRTALTASGANMATITVAGASRCCVSRPSTPVTERTAVATPVIRPEVRIRGNREAPSIRSASSARTLRQAVIGYFNAELARYGGQADVVFDRTPGQVLDLSGPAFQFRVRRRSGTPLGLIQMEVDVLAEGGTVQTVPLVVKVAMSRRVAVARRSINQGATLRASDLKIMPITFTRLDKLGIGDLAYAIGQRAKRFIPAGNLIKSEVLESVPLVTRGQLVTFASVVGNVRVVTTAKATGDGMLGETITVRSLDRGRVEFDGVVTGPGEVQIGIGPTTSNILVHATGESS